MLLLAIFAEWSVVVTHCESVHWKGYCLLALTAVETLAIKGVIAFFWHFIKDSLAANTQRSLVAPNRVIIDCFCYQLSAILAG
jgi:hypothetical protein